MMLVWWFHVGTFKFINSKLTDVNKFESCIKVDCI